MKFTLASVLLAAPLALSNPILRSHKARAVATMLDANDFALVNLARNLESLELNLWNMGLMNYTAAQFNGSLAAFYPYLSLFRDQEIAHFTLLNDLAGGNFTNCTYTFPVTTAAEFVQFGQVVTSVGEGAFLGALSLLDNKTVAQGAGEIIGNEARQNSKLREGAGIDYFGAVNFDTPLTAVQAYSLAEPYFKCPASNAPITFPLAPPLTASFVNTANATHKGGDAIMLKWNATSTYLGPDVHITFLGGMMSLTSPLNQTGNGTGMTTLPDGINGTAFLVATNYAGPAPIPDNQNYAVGYVVVA